MFKTYDRETGITTWNLPNWWDKFFYVMGSIWTAFLVLAFIIGMIEGILE